MALSGVLNSIMRAFAELRVLVETHAELARKLEALERRYDAQFRSVFDAIRQLMNPPPGPRKQIGSGFERNLPSIALIAADY